MTTDQSARLLSEIRQLLPTEFKDITDEKALAIVSFLEKIWYPIIEEEFSSRGL